jgi:hypothetical protein
LPAWPNWLGPADGIRPVLRLSTAQRNIADGDDLWKFDGDMAAWPHRANPTGSTNAQRLSSALALSVRSAVCSIGMGSVVAIPMTANVILFSG